MKTLVAGIGSLIRGDDGVGVHAVRRLRRRPHPRGVDFGEFGTAGFGLLDVVEGYDMVILVDALVSGGEIGTVSVLTGSAISKAVHTGIGHEANLSSVLSLGRRFLGRRMPQQVFVVAVEAGEIHTFSEVLTPKVQESLVVVDAVVASLLNGDRTID